MQVLYQRCAGIDVHLRFLVVCLSIVEAGQRRKEIRSFRNETADLLALRAWLLQEGCTHVGMESTGVYTPPPMLQIGGGTVRSGCRRDRTDAEDHADLLFIYLNAFDQGTDTVPTRLKISVVEPIFPRDAQRDKLKQRRAQEATIDAIREKAEESTNR